MTTRGDLLTLLHQAHKDGFYYVAFYPYSNKIYRDYYCPIRMVIAKIQDNFFRRLVFFKDWEYNPVVGSIEHHREPILELYLFQKASEFEKQWNAKIDSLAEDIIQNNQKQAQEELRNLRQATP